MNVDLLAQMAVESLVEDEALRGDLTDQGYQPLLDWAVVRVLRCVRNAEQEEDPQPGLEACVAQLRQILRAVVEAADQGDASPLAATLGPPVLDAAETEAAEQELAGLSLSEDRDENARRIAEALSAAAPG